MPILAPSKDPSSILDYGVDWTDWLDGDTISTSSWSVSPSGLTAISNTRNGGVTTVWLSGGTVGQTYQVTNTIVTAAGRTDQRTLLVAIQDR